MDDDGPKQSFKRPPTGRPTCPLGAARVRRSPLARRSRGADGGRADRRRFILGRSSSDWPQTRLPAGAFLAPGFIDLQVNGGGGVLLNDQPTPDGMRTIARAHRRFGTTACLPTLISDTRAQMRAAITAARATAGRDGVLG